ncbi:hypothetical protein K492DRAFT_203095 [Lichtheimia hyalospora FSU 10163]|nr:hypothetical protein K492DRAFT_203095 [Lichtheimia hyalospora FSU 10163]
MADNKSTSNSTSSNNRQTVQPSELAKAFAPRIEVASLAIRATAQTSLFPDLVSSSPYHLTPLDYRRRPSSAGASLPTTITSNATARPSFSSPSLHVTDISCPFTTPSSPPPPPPPQSTTGSGKRVTFSSDIDTIEICGDEEDEEDNLLESPDSDLETQDDSDELFSAGDDDDDDDDILLEQDDSMEQDMNDDDNNTLDHQAPPDTSTAASSLTTPSSPINPPSPQDPATHAAAPVLRLDPSKVINESRKPTTTQPHKGYRIMGDEVLSELVKRNNRPSQQRWDKNHPIPSLLNPPLPPSAPTANNLRSVESQIREAMLRTRNQKRTQNNNNVLPPFSSSSFSGEFGSSLLDELDRIATQRDGSNSSIDLPTRYTERIASKVIYATVNEQSSHDEQHSTTTEASIPSHEPVWKSLKSSSSPNLAGSRSNNGGGGRLYLKVLAAENLDFPIDLAETPYLRCVLSDGVMEYVSDYMPMRHTVEFNWDCSIDVKPDSEFTLTLQVGGGRPTTESKSQLRRLFGNHRRPRTDSILRYINQPDGAIAQARVSFASVQKQCRRCICTASFALINGWYQFAKSGLLVAKQRKDDVPEKAVGKLTSKLFFVPETSSLPSTFEQCEQGLNILRYSQTCWQTGYMSQLGGDLKYWRRRYYTLRGWRLFSYTDTIHAPRTVIDLSRAISITADNRIVSSTTTIISDLSSGAENEPLTASSSSSSSSSSVLMTPPPPPSLPREGKALSFVRPSSSISVGSATTASDDDIASCSVKNSFRILFETGESIDFFCDSALEREKWLDVLSVIIGHVPEWPIWMTDEQDDCNISTHSEPIIHVPPASLFSL